METFHQIREIKHAMNGAIVVLACDEMGVVPSHRDRIAANMEELPAWFFGVRPWLRQRLCGAYGCVEARDPDDNFDPG